MKVKELIKELQKYPGNMAVEIDIGEIKAEPIKKVEQTFYTSRSRDGIVLVPKRIQVIKLEEVK